MSWFPKLGPVFSEAQTSFKYEEQIHCESGK